MKEFDFSLLENEIFFENNQSKDEHKIIENHKKVIEKSLSLVKPYIEEHTILGIDIYKYSEYDEGIQEFIPILFDFIYLQTVWSCIRMEKFIFQTYWNSGIAKIDPLKDFKEYYISTGDGGFQIFQNPIQAVTFAAYFQQNVKVFNSLPIDYLPPGYENFENKKKSHYISQYNLSRIVKRIELRYAITHDKIFKFNKNYFGPGIINNARILAKDHLNRLLVDEKTIVWFDENINSVENLLIFKIDSNIRRKIKYFENYIVYQLDKGESESDPNSFLFGTFDNADKIISVDVLKIGNIKSKSTTIEVFNLKIQFQLAVDEKSYEDYVVTLGNLNTQGIE